MFVSLLFYGYDQSLCGVLKEEYVYISLDI